MRDPSFAQTLDYRIAVGRFESALEASERLPDDDRELLLREVGAVRKVVGICVAQSPRH